MGFSPSKYENPCRCRYENYSPGKQYEISLPPSEHENTTKSWALWPSSELAIMTKADVVTNFKIGSYGQDDRNDQVQSWRLWLSLTSRNINGVGDNYNTGVIQGDDQAGSCDHIPSWRLWPLEFGI